MQRNRQATRAARRLAGVLAATALAAAACSGGDGSADAPLIPPTTAERPPATTAPAEQPDAASGSEQAPADTQVQAPAEPPHAAELPWGNFALASRIAGKLERGERLNFVISLAETGADDGPSAVFGDGWERAGADAAARYGGEVNPRIVGPFAPDADAQAVTVEALIASGDIGCLALDAADPQRFAGVIDLAVEAGIPAFTVGRDTPSSRRFAHHGVDSFAAGEKLGRTIGEWAVAESILLRRAGLVTGNAGSQQSFDLMRGFVAGLTDIHSGIDWANEPTTVEPLGLDAPLVYDAVEAWLAANPDIDIVFAPDETLEQVAAVIADGFLYGDVYGTGFHLNSKVAAAMADWTVIAAMSPSRAESAYRAGAACADFLLDGAFETGLVAVEPLVVTQDNLDDRDWSAPQHR